MTKIEIMAERITRLETELRELTLRLERGELPIKRAFESGEIPPWTKGSTSGHTSGYTGHSSSS